MYLRYEAGDTKGHAVMSYFFFKIRAFNKLIEELYKLDSVKANRGNFVITDIKIV